MSNFKGYLDPNLVPLTWFDETITRDGRWDRDLVPATNGAINATGTSSGTFTDAEAKSATLDSTGTSSAAFTSAANAAAAIDATGVATATFADSSIKRAAIDAIGAASANFTDAESDASSINATGTSSAAFASASTINATGTSSAAFTGSTGPIVDTGAGGISSSGGSSGIPLTWAEVDALWARERAKYAPTIHASPPEITRRAALNAEVGASGTMGGAAHRVATVNAFTGALGSMIGGATASAQMGAACVASATMTGGGIPNTQTVQMMIDAAVSRAIAELDRPRQDAADRTRRDALLAEVRSQARQRADHIEHRGSEWIVMNEARTRVLGRYKSEPEAQKRLAQIEYYKQHGDLRE